MKISAFAIEHFGLWSSLTVPKLSAGINVFYGANENGKTTILEFVRSQIYGFSDSRKHYARKPGNVYLPHNAEVDQNGHSLFVRSGGMLQLDCPSGQYTLHRLFEPEKTPNEDTVELYNLDGAKQGHQLLRVLISGVDETTFNNVFAIGLDELQRISSLSDTEAAEMLFRLSTGMERISIVEAIKEITGKRNKILNIAEKEHEPAQLTQLFRKREKLIEELDGTKLLLRQYVQLRSEHKTVERNVRQFEEELTKLQHEQRLYEIAKLTKPIWERRDAVQKSLMAMGSTAAVPNEVITQLAETEKELENRRQIYAQLKGEYGKAHNAVKTVPVNETLLKMTPHLELLLDEEQKIIDINGQITAVETEAAALEKQLTEEEELIRKGRRSIAVPSKRSAVQSEPGGAVTNSQKEIFDAETLGGYRVPAHAVNTARRKLLQLKEKYADAKHRYSTLNEKIQPELAKRESTELAEVLDAARDTAVQLKKRQEFQQRLTHLTEQHRDLRRINTFIVQHQALPAWMLILLGFVGVLGAVPVGLAMFELLGAKVFTAHIHPLLTVLGTIAVAGSIAFKFIAERSNGRKLDENQRQLNAVLSQMEQVKRDVAGIDARFAAASTPPELHTAQQELARLEKLLPVESQRLEAERESKHLNHRLKQTQRQYEHAAKRWNDWLQQVNLPADWTPARIRDLLEHCDIAGDLQKELDKRYELRRQKIRALRDITDRIDKTAGETGLEFAGGLSYVAMLHFIRSKLDENNKHIQQRDKLKHGIREFRRMRKKAVTDLQKAKNAFAGLLREYNAKTPDELRTLHQRYVKQQQLLGQENSIQRELDAALGNYCTEKQVLEFLNVNDEENPFDLDELLTAVNRKIEKTSARQHSELELKGKLSEQMQQITDDWTALKKQRELAILDDKIEKTKKDWQVYAVCSKMLDIIRAAYERERQPRTLAEASEVLRKLTDGKYQRIWTPLGEETLMLDDNKGDTFNIAWLSRGTREQIFVALRLALASEFARHGSMLPMILDDIFVNFDTKRATAAAQLLLEFAATGRQIILLTCHEHICRIFQKLDVPVRILPPVDDPQKPIRVLLPRSVLLRREERRRRQIRRSAREEVNRRLELQLAKRTERIRLEEQRKAEVQRMVLEMQRQATADMAVEADRQVLTAQ
ncbi:MAG: AAA family ATPase [Planctomycetaceae bacterium]|jgi:uncharacterized protein YhaN|nr:AAA family ATPase [Planctomycetaceae bacterium]